MNEQVLKTSGADVLSSRRKLTKYFGGGGGTHPYPLVRPRVNTINWRDTTHFEDDYRIGCENAIHCQPQQSYSGLRSPQRSRP